MTPAEKSQRLLEAASAILHAAPEHRLNIVVLNKALFYLDLASLRDHGNTVTCNSYIALQNGPVIAKYPQRLVGALEASGLARQVSLWNGAKPIELEKTPEHFQFLNSDEMILVTDVTKFFADSTSVEASEFSHKNPGWQIAWNHFLREKKPACVNMRIAMQQIIECDPWMATPTIEDTEILSAADSGIGDDW